MMSPSLKERAVKGILWSGIERFSTAGVNFIIGLIIARLLSPKEYGIIAMLSIFMAISQSVIDSGFSNALIRKQDRKEIDYSTAFMFNLVAGIIMYLFLYIASLHRSFLPITYIGRCDESCRDNAYYRFVFNSPAVNPDY